MHFVDCFAHCDRFESALSVVEIDTTQRERECLTRCIDRDLCDLFGRIGPDETGSPSLETLYFLFSTLLVGDVC